MELTITDKQNYLTSNRGITTISDWGLLTEDDILSQKIVDDINTSFEIILDTLDKKNNYTYGEIGNLFSSAMKEICKKHDVKEKYGLRDSEAHIALARYIAINIDIDMYDYARYDIKW